MNDASRIICAGPPREGGGRRLSPPCDRWSGGEVPGVRARTPRAGAGRPWCAALLGAALALAYAAGPARAQAELPDDWAVLHDARVEVQKGLREGRDERWLVMRYLAPQIARDGGSLAYEDVADAIDALCDGPGLATARAHESPVDQIVITVMDRVVEWGLPNPEATQFIASYVVTQSGCEWQ